jgi:cell wall-associated NlpC family hydrolase
MTREWAVYVALSNLGHPYRWGGDDPMAGFDCSGLVIHCLQSVGELPQSFDSTAAGLFARFRDAGNELRTPPFSPGSLVFYSHDPAPARIHHVEMILNCDLSIGASSGGSATLTEADAIAQNAFVKIRPMLGPHRPRHIFYADPFG